MTDRVTPGAVRASFTVLALLCALVAILPNSAQAAGAQIPAQCVATETGDGVELRWNASAGKNLRKNGTWIGKYPNRTHVDTSGTPSDNYAVVATTTAGKTFTACVLQSADAGAGVCTRASTASGQSISFQPPAGVAVWHVRRDGKWLAKVANGSTYVDEHGSSEASYIARYRQFGVRYDVACGESKPWVSSPVLAQPNTPVQLDPDVRNISGRCASAYVGDGVNITWTSSAGVDEYEIFEGSDRVGTSSVRYFNHSTGTVDSTYAVLLTYDSGAQAVLSCHSEMSCTSTLSHRECSALLDLRSLSGYYAVADWWDADNEPCEWSGVICDNGRISELHIAEHDLTWLPDSFNNLAGLKHLDLSDNELFTLPSGFGVFFSALESLNLASNNLGDGDRSPYGPIEDPLPPMFFGNMDALETLNLRHNDLTSDELSVVGGLGSLSWLDVTGNNISAIPDSFANLGSLTYLDLTFNEMSELSSVIGEIKTLETLLVPQNDLSSVASSVGSLTQLRVLNLETNGLTQLPAEVGALAALEELALGANDFSGDISPWISGFAGRDQDLELELGPTCLTVDDDGLVAWLNANVVGRGWTRCP